MTSRSNPAVWGIGLTRTGTLSLNRALEILGYRAVHYPTLQTLLHEPLQAATDEPVAVTYKYLDFMYPNSKFVLTERDEDDWIASTAAHRRRHFARLKPALPEVETSSGSSDPNWIQVQTAAILRQSLLRDRAVERIFTQMVLYETLEFDEHKFREGYRRYHDDVTRYFANRPGDLLRLRVSQRDAWKRLCDFLGHPVPKVPFPALNVSRSRQ
jgi:Sulfotransferase domain